MDLDLTPDERAVADAFERLFEKESSIERVRHAEATGFDADLWAALTEMGAVGLAVPESAGGGGGGMVELSLAAEAAGRRLVCAPLVEACVAARVLAAAGFSDSLAELLDGGAPVVLAPRPARDGIATLVPGGAVAAAVVALDDDELVLVRGTRGTPVDELGFLALADRTTRGADRQVLGRGPDARRLWEDAVGWWRIAAAATCVGIAAQALDVACDYARTREQFGVPIGSFQAMQQLLADVIMAVDGGRLLVREAAWHADHRDGWHVAADVAYLHAADAAVTAAEACLHVHGGYGYTLEYDAQLYLRRAKAMMLVGGDPERLFEHVGAVTIAGGR